MLFKLLLYTITYLHTCWGNPFSPKLREDWSSSVTFSCLRGDIALYCLNLRSDFSHCFFNWNAIWSFEAHLAQIWPGSPSFGHTYEQTNKGLKLRLWYYWLLDLLTWTEAIAIIFLYILTLNRDIIDPSPKQIRHTFPKFNSSIIVIAIWAILKFT